MPRGHNFKCDVFAKASFSADGQARWTSEVAWATVIYFPQQDEIRILHVFKQKHATSELWAKPWFDERALERLLEHARRKYEAKRSGTTRHGPTGPVGGGHLRGHKMQLCERCLELGRLCLGGPANGN